MIKYRENKYGFTYGSATIERLMSDEKKEWVILGLTTPKTGEYKGFQLYVTKTGKTRIYDPSGREWGPKEEE